MHFPSIILFAFAIASVYGGIIDHRERAVCSFFQENGLQNLDLINCPPSTLERREVDPSKRANLCQALFDGGLVNLEAVGCGFNTTRTYYPRHHEGKKHKHHKEHHTEEAVESPPPEVEHEPTPAPPTMAPVPACSSESICSIAQNGAVDIMAWGCSNALAPSLDEGPCNKKMCQIVQHGLIDAALFGC